MIKKSDKANIGFFSVKFFKKQLSIYSFPHIKTQL
jgi:hypothetical protein